jgi:hypothetical protein
MVIDTMDKIGSSEMLVTSYKSYNSEDHIPNFQRYENLKSKIDYW